YHLARLSDITYLLLYLSSFFFFFTAPATTEIYTLSLHDALPISGAAGPRAHEQHAGEQAREPGVGHHGVYPGRAHRRALLALVRSEEHTSELQSRFDLVCRLLLEKKKKKQKTIKLLQKSYTKINY